jgi:hypothetical protein
VPITADGKVVWETPLNRINVRDPLRKNEQFQTAVRRLIVFSDILALNQTGEPALWIRNGKDGSYIPINTNIKATTIVKSNEYDFSVIPKILFTRWFGETVSMYDVLVDMIADVEDLPSYHSNNDLATLLAQVRKRIEEIVQCYDKNYIWYVSFITDRMSRILLAE